MGVGMVGSILTAEGAGSICTSLFTPALLKRYTGHGITSVLALVLGSGMWLVPACDTVTLVAALYFAIGGCLGLLSGCSNTIVTWAHAGHNVGPWVNLINACFGLGSTSAPLIFTYLHGVGTGLASFRAIACFGAGTAVFAALLRSPAPPAPKADEAERRSRKGAARGASAIAGVDLGSREAYVFLTVLAPLMCVMTLGIGGEIAFGAWIYSYATERVGMARHDAALLNSFFWSAFTLGRLGTIPVAALLPPELLLLPAMALNVCVSLLLLGSPTSAGMLWAGTAAMACGFCAIYANVLSLLASYDLVSPVAVSVLQVACAAGHMTVPVGVGAVHHHTSMGHDALFGVLGVTNGACLLLLLGVVSHLRRHFTPASSSIHAARLARLASRQGEVQLDRV